VRWRCGWALDREGKHVGGLCRVGAVAQADHVYACDAHRDGELGREDPELEGFAFLVGPMPAALQDAEPFTVR
jgi:hypothetical protein